MGIGMRRARAATARHESTSVTVALFHRRPPPCRERRRVDRDPRGVRVRGRDGPELAQAGPALELADRVGEPAVPGGREGHCRGISAEKAQEKEKSEFSRRRSSSAPLIFLRPGQRRRQTVKKNRSVREVFIERLLLWPRERDLESSHRVAAGGSSVLARSLSSGACGDG